MNKKQIQKELNNQRGERVFNSKPLAENLVVEGPPTEPEKPAQDT